MNERIKELAEQAGFECWKDEPYRPEGQIIDWASNYDEELEKFAELVRADEREACARVCEEIAEEFPFEPHEPDPVLPAYCAEAIRARGEAEYGRGEK
jgi:hypothetical protein